MSFHCKRQKLFLCTKVSRINKKKDVLNCWKILRAGSKKGSRELQAAWACLGSLCQQHSPAHFGLSGWVVPTQHKTHGALKPRGIAAHHALRGTEAAQVRETHRTWLMWACAGLSVPLGCRHLSPIIRCVCKNTRIGGHRAGCAVGLFYSPSGALVPFSSAPSASSIKLSLHLVSC